MHGVIEKLNFFVVLRIHLILGYILFGVFLLNLVDRDLASCCI